MVLLSNETVPHANLLDTGDLAIASLGQICECWCADCRIVREI